MNHQIIRPLITEKTMALVGQGWYTFAAPEALSKDEARLSIERMYGVQVTRVRSMCMPGKTRRVGRRGMNITHADWKKILVQLKAGQTIEAFQIGGNPEEVQGK